MLLVPLIVRSDCPPLICTGGNRHAPLKESPIHLIMIPEDVYKYIVRGKWHARLPAPVPGSPLPQRLPVLGVSGLWFILPSRIEIAIEWARAEVAYASVHLYTRACRAAQNPFFFVVHCLTRLGEGGWKRGEKNAPRGTQRTMRANVRDPDEKTQIFVRIFWIMINHIIPDIVQMNISDGN